MHFARKAAANALIDGWKSVELCQAFLILSDYAPPARRWEEERASLYKSVAARLAIDLRLGGAPAGNGREARNRERAALIVFNVDRSAAAQFGKPTGVPEVPLVRAARGWYAQQSAHPYDVHLCAYTALLRTVGQFHALVRDEAMAPRMVRVF